jgi:hypothetical protein
VQVIRTDHAGTAVPSIRLSTWMPWMCCRTEKKATEGGNERASGLWAGSVQGGLARLAGRSFIEEGA